MKENLIYAVTGILTYLTGAIPFGYLLVKFRTGRDVREQGSGNVGATNAARTAGLFWFLPVFILDFLKGFVPVFWVAPWVAHKWPCPI